MTDIPTRELPKIRKALERIADGIERYADADPLTVLNEALQGDPVATGADGWVDGRPAYQLKDEPQKPFASNGQTVLYKHPDPRFEVVLRRDASAPSGYVATIEEA